MERRAFNANRRRLDMESIAPPIEGEPRATSPHHVIIQQLARWQYHVTCLCGWEARPATLGAACEEVTQHRAMVAQGAVVVTTGGAL